MRLEPLDNNRAGWVFHESRPGADLPHVLLGLARRAIERRLTDHPRPRPIPDIPELHAKGACFVSLHLEGQLRGCIGSPIAWRSLAEDVMDNAARAAFSDPRFPKVGADEMFRMRLSLSLLSTPQPMDFTDEADLLSQLRPGIDGLSIEDRDRHALFLPAVWEQVSDPAAFLGHLKAKAGMKPGHWSETFQASRFTATEYHEA